MRIVSTLAAATLATALLTSCSDDSTDSTTGAAANPASASTSAAPAPTPTTSPAAPASSAVPQAPAGPVLAITVAGDDISPKAVRLDLAANEPLTLDFDSDRAGTMHVHSKPEQYLEFEAGTSSQELVIERPGLVEVEDDDTGDVVAQIEVR